MNYTQNYHLPQWIKSDRIMMDDFNDAMNSLEDSLTNHASYAASIHDLAGEAHGIARTAKLLALEAYSPNMKPYAASYYDGNGGTKSVVIGFRPSFVIISGMQSTVSYTDTSSFDRYFAITGGEVLSDRVEFTSNGFTVYAKGLGRGNFPELNEDKRRYQYIAFR